MTARVLVSGIIRCSSKDLCSHFIPMTDIFFFFLNFFSFLERETSKTILTVGSFQQRMCLMADLF